MSVKTPKYIDYKDLKLFPIGIGTWGIGGLLHKDSNNNDKKQVDALIHMLSKGMNYIEGNLFYADGYSAKLLSIALKEFGVNRQDIFLVQAIYPYTNESVSDIEDENRRFLEIFNTEYVNAIQFTHEMFIKYDKARMYEFLHKALQNKITKFVSVTNLNKNYLEDFYREFKDATFAHEIGFNFETRENYDNGVIPYATKNNILNVIYQPLRRNRTAKRNWPLLNELANEYDATQNQVILSWLIAKGYLPLVKSENKEHIDENLKSINLKLSKKDIKRIDDFRVSNYIPPKIDWNYNGDGVKISQLSNVFDEEYDNK